MEAAELKTWGGSGGGRHSRSSSNIQPPWECDLLPMTPSRATVGNLLLDTSPPLQRNGSASSIGDYGPGSYLDNSTLPPSPLETLYQKTASFSSNSRYVSTSPTQPDVGTVMATANRHQYPNRNSSSFSEISFDDMRRQSLSGPLPLPEDECSSSSVYRRSSISGPLPFSSNGPYDNSAFDIEFMRTPSPWNQYEESNGGASSASASNPYLNPFSPNGSMNVSSASASPNGIPRPPPHPSNGIDSPSLTSSNSLGGSCNAANGNHADTTSFKGPPVRQLYKGDPPRLGTSLSQSPASPSSPSTGEQWASFPDPGTQKSTDGKPVWIGLSQRTNGSTSLLAGRPILDASNGRGASGENGVEGRVNPNLTKSRSLHGGTLVFQSSTNGKGGTLPFNTRAAFNRSVSCVGAEEMGRKFSKGRGGLGEGVLETLVAQLVFAKERPSMLANMIYSPPKLAAAAADSRGSFGYARDLVERILMAQVHALTPSLKGMAQKIGEEEAAFAANPSRNGSSAQARFPNDGYRFLRLQTQFVEAGLSSFDMLCKVRRQFPSLVMVDEPRNGNVGAGGNSALRIACFGGGPGCEALAIRLFFMRLLPKQLQMHVDILDRSERWKEIVDCISLNGVGLLTADLFDVVFHPTWLRSYRFLIFVDSLGRGMRGNVALRCQNWAEFWSNLSRNTCPGVVVIILEKSGSWEEMKPNKGSTWWCSTLAEDELVHIARKL